MIADGVTLENDGGDFSLIIENSDGTHIFAVDPQDVLDAVEGYRAHLAEGEAIRQEYERSGGISWEDKKAMELSTWHTSDPEGELEMILEQVDLARKAERENRPSFTTTFPRPILHNDPGDEDDRAA